MKEFWITVYELTTLNTASSSRLLKKRECAGYANIVKTTIFQNMDILSNFLTQKHNFYWHIISNIPAHIYLRDRLLSRKLEQLLIYWSDMCTVYYVPVPILYKMFIVHKHVWTKSCFLIDDMDMVFHERESTTQF